MCTSERSKVCSACSSSDYYSMMNIKILPGLQVVRHRGEMMWRSLDCMRVMIKGLEIIVTSKWHPLIHAKRQKMSTSKNYKIKNVHKFNAKSINKM